MLENSQVSLQTGTEIVDTTVSPSPALPPASTSTQDIITPFLESVPEKYRNESYVQEFSKAENPAETLWSTFSTMKGLLDSPNTGLPPADAPVEKWAEWAASVAPKDIEAYGDIKPVLDESKPYLKELLEPVYTPQVINTVLSEAQKLGMQPFQIKGFMDAINKLQVGAAEQYHLHNINTATQRDADFNNLCQNVLGKEAKNIIDEGFNYLAASVPKELVDDVKDLPNKSLAAVAYLAFNLKQKYGREDALPGVGAGHPSAPAETLETLRAKVADLISNPVHKDPFHSGHDAMVKEVDDLCGRIASLTFKK